jgi:two-component system OmpR family response regulator/two-component system alkaline phosphatase synthesis response regulator PhoP
MSDELRKTILVIEDDPQQQTIYTITLERAGYGVVTRPDAYAGLRWLEQISPDLILLDMMLPGMSGLEMLDMIRKTPNGRDVPVMIATASSDVDESDFRPYKIAHFFHKPTLPREIVERINQFFIDSAAS